MDHSEIFPLVPDAYTIRSDYSDAKCIMQDLIKFNVSEVIKHEHDVQ